MSRSHINTLMKLKWSTLLIYLRAYGSAVKKINFVDPFLFIDLPEFVGGGRTGWLSLHIRGYFPFLEFALKDHPTFAQVHAFLGQRVMQISLVYGLVLAAASHHWLLELNSWEFGFGRRGSLAGSVPELAERVGCQRALLELDLVLECDRLVGFALLNIRPIVHMSFHVLGKPVLQQLKKLRAHPLRG